jgi:hypothetical protein
MRASRPAKTSAIGVLAVSWRVSVSSWRSSCSASCLTSRVSWRGKNTRHSPADLSPGSVPLCSFFRIASWVMPRRSAATETETAVLAVSWSSSWRCPGGGVLGVLSVIARHCRRQADPTSIVLSTHDGRSENSTKSLFSLIWHVIYVLSVRKSCDILSQVYGHSLSGVVTYY